MCIEKYLRCTPSIFKLARPNKNNQLLVLMTTVEMNAGDEQRQM